MIMYVLYGQITIAFKCTCHIVRHLKLDIAFASNASNVIDYGWVVCSQDLWLGGGCSAVV